MPKELTPKNAVVMETIAAAVATYPADEHPLSVRDYVSGLRLSRAFSGLPEAVRSDFDAQDVGFRALMLLHISRGQMYDLLDAAKQVVPLDASSRIGPILRNSSSIGRWFGAISQYPVIDDKSNDERLREIIVDEPTHFMMFDPDQDAVRWNSEGEALLRPHISRLSGCPALTHIVEVPGKDRMMLFSLYLEGFTNDFIRHYVEMELPYSPTPAM